MTTEITTLGQAIYHGRTAHGLSMKRLAREAGVTLQTLRGIERGTTRGVHAETRRKLERGLGLSDGALSHLPTGPAQPEAPAPTLEVEEPRTLPVTPAVATRGPADEEARESEALESLRRIVEAQRAYIVVLEAQVLALASRG